MQIPPAQVVLHLTLDLRDKPELYNLELYPSQAKGTGDAQARG